MYMYVAIMIFHSRIKYDKRVVSYQHLIMSLVKINYT